MQVVAPLLRRCRIGNTSGRSSSISSTATSTRRTCSLRSPAASTTSSGSWNRTCRRSEQRQEQNWTIWSGFATGVVSPFGADDRVETDQGLPHEHAADRVTFIAPDQWLPPLAGPSPEPPSERRSEEHTSELQSLMRISYAV